MEVSKGWYLELSRNMASLPAARGHLAKTLLLINATNREPLLASSGTIHQSRWQAKQKNLLRFCWRCLAYLNPRVITIVHTVQLDAPYPRNGVHFYGFEFSCRVHESSKTQARNSGL